MNLEYKHLLPADFAPMSRVWVYQSNRIFGMMEALALEPMLQEFVEGWNSHGAKVKGYANLFFGQFIVIMADETHTDVSGCSTDSSVRLIKQIEQQFNVNLFDRQLLAFVVKDKLQVLPLAHVKHAVENGFITGDTLYFNNLVATKAELENNWIIPVKDSWLKSRLAITA
ncbi:hypothetical protein KJS94_06665 [Flavihumibacter rivuli]|uniref:hypothetical protein n=1 Tax=Flavihumibacter rivuli TaxID=2838156 RepID=UPI001BDDE069|nr:hypothetical protein [Flavihumibacter rivuli]ULQ57879.1 hypothetical protein KJS94_06665 [Flavihumibacter rivuli]